ncbi:MAG: PD-(D/E)XK nuclease family protein [Anaerolineae bacterium]|nr:PD-(D/E)XK nuclease family protein [Anaerolineae bacterium]
MLPPDFVFTQANLQDYVECRRRFQLRYLWELAWPAIEAEPADDYEAHVRDGELFHQLVHQHQLGLGADRLQAFVAAAAEESGGQLAAWWENYRKAGPSDLPEQRYPELTLSAPLGDHRLLAKYDLVAIAPGLRAEIVDWKTGTSRPSRAMLAARLQTRVYRYVLVQAGAQLNDGQPFRPEQVAMRYWFANFPDQAERFPYDATQYEADGKYLTALVAEIAVAGEGDFPLTDDVRRCRFCAYRSLCDRGSQAGHMAEAEVEPEPEVGAGWAEGFDFEQVAEIAF